MKYNLDREMTKEELQMENRFLRNQLKRLSELFTELDLKVPEAHALADRMLYEIQRTFRAANAGASEMIRRAIDRENI